MELKLDGVWRLKRWDPDAPMDEVFSPAFLPEGWLEVPVPGDVRPVGPRTDRRLLPWKSIGPGALD